MMEITKEFLEDEVAKVREQATIAANIVQQAIGAEMALRSVLATLETDEQEKSETKED